MPIYSYECEPCKSGEFERASTIAARHEQLCDKCGRVLIKLIRMGTVVPDDIPGGLLVKHGICNGDGSPRRYYSKSEIRKACAEKGVFCRALQDGGANHVGERGSDKSKYTSRWT